MSKKAEFIEKFNVDLDTLKIIHCPNKKEPFLSEYNEKEEKTVSQFRKSDCDKCRYKKNCIKEYYDDTYYKVTIEKYKNEKNINNDVQTENKLDSYYNNIESIKRISIIPSHNIFAGIKEYILGDLEQLIYHLKNKCNNDNFIKYKVREILNLLDNGNEIYLELLEGIAKDFNFEQNKIEELLYKNKDVNLNNELNCMERSLIRNEVDTILEGYIIEPKVDYEATRVMLEFCYRAVRSGLLENKHVMFPRMYITKEDILVEWTCDFKRAKEFKAGINEKDIIVESLWMNIDKCKKELKVVDKLYGLKEDTLKKIYLNLSEEDNKKSDEKDIIESYINIINAEYKRLLNLLETKSVEKELSFDEIYSKIITSNDLSSKHIEYLEKLNKVVLRYRYTSDYKEIIKELNSILFDNNLLLMISNEIFRLKKNKNLKYVFEMINLSDTQQGISNLYNNQYITLFELKKCINKIESSINEISFKILEEVQIGKFGYYGDRESRKIPKSPYAIDKGLKELLLGEFDQLKQVFTSKKPNRYSIDFLIKDIGDFTFVNSTNDIWNLKEKYIDEVNHIFDLFYKDYSKKTIKENAKNLTELDFTIFRCVNCCINEIKTKYNQIVKDKNINYNYNLCKALIKVAEELLQQDQSYILKNIYNPIIELYVDTNNILIGFTITENIKDFKQEYKYPVINFINIDLLEKPQIDYVKKLYSMLTDKGRIFFSSAERIHEHLESLESEDFDYSTYCLGYLKCIEHELKDRFGDLIKENIAGIKPNLTLGSFAWAFNNNKSKIEEILSKNITDEFISNLNYIVNIRNDADHTEVITLSIYENVRKIIINDGFLIDILKLNEKNKVIYDINKKEISYFYDKLNDIILEFDGEPIQKPNFSNSDLEYEKVMMLNHISFTFFNYAISYPPINILENRFISSEVDLDTYGYLMIKEKLNEKMGIRGVEFDYVGYEEKEHVIKLLFRSKIYEKQMEVPGYFTLIYEDNKFVINPSDGAKKLRKYLYSNLYDSEELKTEDMMDIYIKAMNKYINLLLNDLNQEKGIYNDVIKKIILSEDIWSKFNKKIVQSFNIIKEIILTIVIKETLINIKEKEVLIKSCKYILENINKIFFEDKKYLYPYATIFADKTGEILNIVFEDANNKENNLEAMFEIKIE